MRPVHLDRRGTQLLHELLLQLARAQAHRIGQRLHRLLLQRAVGNHRQCALHAFFAQMLLRLRRQLRPAAQTRAVSGRAGRRGSGVVADIGRLRRRCRTHRAAIDAGAAHGGQKQPVETCIARQAGTVALGSVGRRDLHGASLCACPRTGWPFSDRGAAGLRVMAGSTHPPIQPWTAGDLRRGPCPPSC